MVLFLVVASIVLAVAATIDGLSTIYALAKGAEERNPLFGKRPSGLRVFLQGTAIIGAEVGVSWLLHSYKPVAGTVAGALMLLQSLIHFVLGYKNYQIK
jgi:hypothetical protein